MLLDNMIVCYCGEDSDDFCVYQDSCGGSADDNNDNNDNDDDDDGEEDGQDVAV